MKKNNLKLIIGAIAVMFVMLAFAPVFLESGNDSILERKIIKEDESGYQKIDKQVETFSYTDVKQEEETDKTNIPDFNDDEWPIRLPSTSYYYLPDGKLVDFDNMKSRSSGSSGQPLSREKTMMVPKMEIVVLGVNEENNKIEGAVLDDHNNSYKKLEEFAYPYVDDDGYAKIAAGDVDGDDLDEIVIAIEHNESIDFIVLDDSKNNFTELAHRTCIDGEIEIEDYMLEIAVGDIDKDYIDEILITDCYDEEISYLWIFDDAENDFKQIDFKYFYGKEPDIVLADLDGDLNKEIAWARVYNYTKDKYKDITLAVYKYMPNYLFSLDSKYIEHLQNDSATEELMDAFKENDYPLSNVATIQNNTLFSLDCSSLDEGEVDDDLIDDFYENNRSLSINARVYEINDNKWIIKQHYVDDEKVFAAIETDDGLNISWENWNWTIKDGDKIYVIKKVNNELKIFNSTTAVFQKINAPHWGFNGEINAGGMKGDGNQDVALGAGDITGDRTEELLVLSGKKGKKCIVYAYDYIPEAENFSEYNNKPQKWRDLVKKNKKLLFNIETGDIDGDRIDEVIIGGTNYDDGGLEWWVFDDAQYNFEKLYHEEFDEEDEDFDWEKGITTGDIDCDGYEEIIFFGTQEGEDDIDYYLRGYIYDDGSPYNEEKKEHNFTLFHNSTWMNNWIMPSVTVADVDEGDGMVLEYTYENWEYVTNATPFVVLAAPPTVKYPEISQGYDSSGTTFGKSSYESTGSSREVGFSAFASIEVSVGFSLGTIGIQSKFSVSMSAEFTRTNTQTQIFTTGQEFGGGSDYDLVIYEKTSYDVFKYQIISSPNETQIGEYMNVKVPKETLMYKEPVQYFNQMENIATKVGEFRHHIGKPWTYPTRAFSKRLLNIYGGWESSPMAVANSGGATSVSISLAEEETTEESTTMSMEISAGVEAGGVCVMAGAGFSEGHTSSITTGQECVYVGCVGDISNREEYLKYKYNWGMYVYNFKRAGHVGYQIINYWVSDYKGPMDDTGEEDIHCLAFYNNENVTDNVTVDCSSYGADARVHGATQIVGHMGRTLLFDGIDDYVSIDSPFFTIPPENLSATAFIELNDLKNNQTIIYSGERGEFQLYVKDNTLFFRVRLEGKEEGVRGKNENEPTWFFTSKALDSNQTDWFHIAGTYQQGKNISLYINGELQESKKVPNIPIFNPGMENLASIGSYNQGGRGFFNGSIDEVKVFDRPLNDTEIQSEYNRVMEGEVVLDEDEGDGIGIIFYSLVLILVILCIGMIAIANKKPKEKEPSSKPVGGVIDKKEDKEEEIDTEVCIYCGSKEDVHKGHLIAPSKGGKKTVSACKICNSSKGDKALMEWLRWVKENKSERWESIITHNKGKRNEVSIKIQKIRDEPSKLTKEKEDDEIEN